MDAGAGPFVRLLAQAVRSTGMAALTNILCFDWRVWRPCACSFRR